MFGRIQKFVTEVVSELKKVSWSTRREVVDSTWVILVSTALLGIFIASSDFALSKLIGVMIQ